MTKELFIAISDQILSVEPLVYVRRFNDQFNKMDEGAIIPVAFPCVLLEFELSEDVAVDSDKKRHYRNLILRAHVGMREDDAGDGTLDQNLNIYDLKDRIFLSLQNFAPNNSLLISSGLTLFNEVEDNDHANFSIHVLSFRFNYIDNSMSNQRVSNSAQMVTPELIVEIDKNHNYNG